MDLHFGCAGGVLSFWVYGLSSGCDGTFRFAGCLICELMVVYFIVMLIDCQ